MLVLGDGELLGSIEMILSFVSDFFFFFLPQSFVVFFSQWEAVRELKTEGKSQGYL